MFHTGFRLVVLGGTILLTLLIPFREGPAYASGQALALSSATTSLFATGLDNPRGLKFDSDGTLYVAEGGQGGTNSTLGQCSQVSSPKGPYTSGMTARISKISPTGVRTTVVDHLPSSQTSAAGGSWVSGVADVAFINHRLYGLLSGAGCSHGIAQIPNGIIQLNSGQDGWALIANLSDFIQTHPVERPPSDFEPDGTWYSLIQANGDLYALEPNRGELDKIELDGKISRVADLSASLGHTVPTAMAFHDGNFYVGNFGTFPIPQGSSKILKITLDGQISTIATGLTTVLGIAFDGNGQLYALENTVGYPSPTPGAGVVVRVTASGELEEVASGLILPTAMAFGPDGKLYVSTFGFSFGPGMGQIMHIDIGRVISVKSSSKLTTGDNGASNPVHRPRRRGRR